MAGCSSSDIVGKEWGLLLMSLEGNERADSGSSSSRKGEMTCPPLPSPSTTSNLDSDLPTTKPSSFDAPPYSHLLRRPARHSSWRQGGRLQGSPSSRPERSKNRRRPSEDRERFSWHGTRRSRRLHGRLSYRQELGEFRVSKLSSGREKPELTSSLLPSFLFPFLSS